jgi:nucleolar protein 56
MQAVAAIDDLERAANLLAKRLRQWYALYCPELEHAIADHKEFIETILTKEKIIFLKESHQKNAMGADLSKVDYEQIEKLAKELQQFYKEKEDLEAYIEKTMMDLCPNLTALLGAKLAAELLAHARSLQRLAFLPASTLQLLGAEQALFRFLKKQGRCPKHGVLLKHPFFGQIKRDAYGKLARHLAGAASKAAKLDYFKGDSYQGYILLDALKKRLETKEKKPKKETEKGE